MTSLQMTELSINQWASALRDSTNQSLIYRLKFWSRDVVPRRLTVDKGKLDIDSRRCLINAGGWVCVNFTTGSELISFLEIIAY